MKKFFTFFFALVLATMLCANNITISNLSLTGKNTTDHYTLVQFDISWENSFRVSIGPANWDAAWVFVKYRVPVSNGGDGLWKHTKLNNTGQTVPSGSVIEIGLLTPGTAFNATFNLGLGAFIYRSADGTGTFSKTGVQLRWNYGANSVADDANVEIQIYAIEMVYVPQGSFYVGSGGTESGAFHKYPTTTNPYQVTSEGQTTVGTATDNLYYPNPSGNSGDQAGPIPAAFPKGYNAFYCMKYEISQQEYVDFLNSLSYTQQATRTEIAIPPSSGAGTFLYNTNRNKIKISTSGTNNTVPAIYATDYPYVACNYLSWADLDAYLDWSGLRPMTELEFEKACRGTGSAVPDEYAWGSTSIIAAAGISNSGLNNETASNSGANACYANSGSGGPIRVGAFTKSSSTRVTAGATYYGIMEMSGNLWERTVTVGNTTGRAFTGAHGDGNLTGDANPAAWPGTDAVGAGFRGGNWDGVATHSRVSDREFTAFAWVTRMLDYGGRGVRGISPPYIGQSYGGGIIFYIDGTGQHGLIAAPSDQVAAQWGCIYTTISGADGTAIGTGNQNTIDIIAGCATAGIAARLCGDLDLGGYSDWYLPSKDELSQLYINRVVVGGFCNGCYYYSSTESADWLAWVVYFYTGWDGGGLHTMPKDVTISVRAVRAF